MASDRALSRSRRIRPPTASEQLEALLGYHVPMGPTAQARPVHMDRHRRLAAPVPVTQAEIEVFEQWFGDLFDELFGPGG